MALKLYETWPCLTTLFAERATGKWRFANAEGFCYKWDCIKDSPSVGEVSDRRAVPVRAVAFVFAIWVGLLVNAKEPSRPEPQSKQNGSSNAEDERVRAVGELTIKGTLKDRASHATPFAVQNEAMTLLLDVEVLEFDDASVGKVVAIRGTLMRNIDNGGMYLTDISMNGKPFLSSKDGIKKYRSSVNPFLIENEKKK